MPTADFLAGRPLPKDVDSAFTTTLSDVLRNGAAVSEAGQPSTEIIGYESGMENGRWRVLNSPTRPINIVGAIARLTWMLAGNNRLDDIAFYEPKVLRYTDDQLTVPGSSYGMRLMQPRPGINQLEGVIGRLRDDPASRRAAAVVWSPEDAVRDSKDIPCAFGVFYHVRASSLIASTVMRSNNAFVLLPYNFFEFSLLGEMVAAEVGVDFGSYLHWAASMHVFDREREAATSVVEAGVSESIEMPPMPQEPSPLVQANLLCRVEPLLRRSDTAQQVEDHLTAVRANGLIQYWWDFAGVLAIHKILALQDHSAARRVREQLSDWLVPLVEHLIEDEPSPDGQLFLDLPSSGLEDVRVVEEAARLQARDYVFEVLMKLAEEGIADPPISEVRRIVEASQGWDAVALAARDGDLHSEIERLVRAELGR